ncbi:MAG: hypothetical protein ACC652_15355, partial [Acidimicrobiales bacterium]
MLGLSVLPLVLGVTTAPWAVAVMVAGAGLSVLVTAFALLTARRAARVRSGFEVARVVLGLGTVFVLAAVTGVSTSASLIALAGAAGLAFGFVQGRSLVVELRDERIFATRSLLGVGVWAVGLVAMQLAGLGSRTGLFALGQAVAIFSVAMLIGVMWGRAAPVQQARRAGTALLPIILLVAGITLFSSNTADARNSCWVGNESSCMTEDEAIEVMAQGFESGLYFRCAEEGFGGDDCSRLYEALLVHLVSRDVEDGAGDLDLALGVPACLFPFSESDTCQERLAASAVPDSVTTDAPEPEPAPSVSQVLDESQPENEQEPSVITSVDDDENATRSVNPFGDGEVAEGVDVTTEEGLQVAVAAVIAAVAMGVLTLAEAG